ncbi:MAG: hypothetical protein Q8Q44_09295, partial [Nocardioides sp.]|nr:hypothetical protein [Nocardioides sp.]
MFEAMGGPVPTGGVYAAAGPVDAATVRGWQQRLSASLEDVTAGPDARDDAGLDDAVLVDLIRGLEELKCTAEAAQAAAAVGLDASQRRAQAAAGVPAARQGRGVAAQVALARRESHHKGRQ